MSFTDTMAEPKPRRRKPKIDFLKASQNSQRFRDLKRLPTADIPSVKPAITSDA